MSISNEALQKLVQEIESQAINSQRDLLKVKQSIASKTREIRLLELTSKEVSTLPSGTNVYEGVGKMFVFSPTAEVDKRLTTETTDLKSDIKNLEKKIQYLETTVKNSREHMDQIFNSGGRA
ncbi:Prefoldin beta-like protein [Mollisia scopiformis]|uniref:Prefoldin beta-like protein n=1 Tax=Mollisia scopiformis TaxID=149040 RepID=A0A194XK91_MOLSC|nr:Prefoldin beta-like protein [Mollisia scopiformis]KUJ20578.1 Prefoldin beta-like protein [Mollisia scopiformis]